MASFLTEVSATEEPDGMRKVRDYHKMLQDSVSDLSDKIAKLLREREKDFLAAYRHHMYNVQKELQDAKKKVKEAKDELKNNNQIRSLKKERDWFQKEATRLDNLAEARKNELESLQVKLGQTRDDRTWLEKQLKTAKRQNKILTAELGMQLHRGMEGSMVAMGQPRPHSTSSLGSTGQVVLPPMTGGSASPSRQQRLGQSMGGGEDDADTVFYLRGTVRDLEDKLKDTKRKMKGLQQLARTYGTKGEFEELFRSCVQLVKQNATQRRRKTAVKMRRSFREASRSELAEIGLQTTPELSDLTAADKRQILEQMLNSDEVFTTLYDKTFPATGPQTTTRMRPDGSLVRV